MKKVVFTVLLVFCIVPAIGQSLPSKTDSLLAAIENRISVIEGDVSTLSNIGLKREVGRFKVYPTTNVYNSLKLDTMTGEVKALQIGLGSDTPFEYKVAKAVNEDNTIVGRYELYPTNNDKNFILIDTIYGIAYQVQWSTKTEECGRWLFW